MKKLMCNNIHIHISTSRIYVFYVFIEKVYASCQPVKKSYSKGIALCLILLHNFFCELLFKVFVEIFQNKTSKIQLKNVKVIITNLLNGLKAFKLLLLNH